MESGGIEHQHPPSDLWQILHGPQTQDGPELQFEHFYIKQRRQHRATTLNFGASDWHDVIQRGYSWTALESFVNQRECVYVGPFWIRKALTQVNHTDTFMKLGKLYLAKNNQQTDHSNDDDIKSLFPSFLKLLSLNPDRKTCSIYAESRWWLSVIQNESEIVLDYLDIHKHDHLDATTLHLAAAVTKKMVLFNCSIVSTSSAPYTPPTNRPTKDRLQILDLVDTNHGGVDLFVSFIQKCTALEKLSIRYDPVKTPGLHFTSDQWMALLGVCSACMTLKVIYFESVNVETDFWLPGLELLMRSQSLSEIEYYLNFHENPTQRQTIPHVMKVSRTNAIVQALMCNKNIIRLDIFASEIDDATFKSKILPILDCNIIWKNVPPFCQEMDDTRGSTQLLGRLLSHRLLHRNPSFLFELVCKVNHQLSHMWHDGRHRKLLMAEEDTL